MIIPYTDLNEETLNNLIEQFVLREGTEYGAEDVSLPEKVLQVKQQLKSREAVIVYSELHESVNILPAAQFSDKS
ncbi:YheU family protein [Oceanisphaera pacifica]|uniref:YheU family protein n=1 Tax=Oceanisphaera pacifica TaxID=2818389 RepID=A0ABS3NDA9_9GAMM|nr:YheU family protein [Oceanisphaera pacifica]